MKVEIREICPCDYKAVLSLWNCELDNPMVTENNIAGTYEKMATDDNYHTFVAVVDNETAGLVTTAWVMAAGYPVGYLKINGLSVKKQFQHQGIGTKLMERAEALARETGAMCIGLASGFKRLEAHAFYEHLGYEKGSYWFGKMIQ